LRTPDGESCWLDLRSSVNRGSHTQGRAENHGDNRKARTETRPRPVWAMAPRRELLRADLTTTAAAEGPRPTRHRTA
jgi:hypothetical protein